MCPTATHCLFVLGLAAAILQAGKWQFLFFKGTFDVRLHVVEAPEDRTITFTLAESTFMKNFEGRWQVGASCLNICHAMHNMMSFPVGAATDSIRTGLAG